ncbi:MAG: oxalyl-CoA decarboxylase [Acidobacteriaceae bacterium]|nr:oxalyl-CoA decarboxylase [Acidobacteriaceae bacterium]
MENEVVQPTLTDGFHLVVDALKLNGLDTMYGVVGIPVTDLARLAQSEGIRYIGFRNEQSAGHAAAIAGYLTQKPGICLTVSAPGFLNGMVALANATTNGYPMIQISGSSDRAIVDLQQGDYEELDQMNAAKPFTKASFRVERPEDIGIGVARAIRAAVSGRPGGVYLDLPAAVLSATVDAQVGADSLIQVVDPAPRRIPSQESISRAIDLLQQAKKPLIVLGKGAAYSQADAEVRKLIESTGIPFLPMSMAKGLLPDGHVQSAASARSLVLAEADVVLLIGARLNWLLGHGKSPQWSASAKFIQIDIEPTEMDSNRKITAPIVGDIYSSVSALLADPELSKVQAEESWVAEIAARKEHNATRMAAQLAAEPAPMNFSSALSAVRDVLEKHPDTYLVNEGANSLDFARNIIDMSSPRRRLDTGTWGVMGIGMGYAIAAAVVSGKPVVAIEGDSAFGFSGMDIETICRYNLPVITVILNNGGIYHGDEASHGSPSDVAPTRLMQNARYEMVIEAFGGVGYSAKDKKELTQALTAALAAGKPALINCQIDPKAGTESGHIKNLNPKSALTAKS